MDQNGNAIYYAWYELLPEAETYLFQVYPGDMMSASIVYSGPNLSLYLGNLSLYSGPIQWTISISDQNLGSPTSFTVDYDSTFTSVEWIHEATSLCGSPTSCVVQALTSTTDAPFYSASETVGAPGGVGQTGGITDLADIQIVLDDSSRLGFSSIHLAAEPGCLPNKDRFDVTYTDSLPQVPPIMQECTLSGYTGSVPAYQTQAGTSLTIGYLIFNDNNGATSYGLGASIRPTGVPGTTYNDQTNDTTALTPSGISVQERYFNIPASVGVGTYDWTVSLWSGKPGQSSMFTTSGWSNGGLQIIPAATTTVVSTVTSQTTLLQSATTTLMTTSFTGTSTSTSIVQILSTVFGPVTVTSIVPTATTTISPATTTTTTTSYTATVASTSTIVIPATVTAVVTNTNTVTSTVSTVSTVLLPATTTTTLNSYTGTSASTSTVVVLATVTVPVTSVVTSTVSSASTVVVPLTTTTTLNSYTGTVASTSTIIVPVTVTAPVTATVTSTVSSPSTIPFTATTTTSIYSITTTQTKVVTVVITVTSAGTVTAALVAWEEQG
jgi:hypothetical protein